MTSHAAPAHDRVRASLCSSDTTLCPLGPTVYSLVSSSVRSLSPSCSARPLSWVGSESGFRPTVLQRVPSSSPHSSWTSGPDLPREADTWKGALNAAQHYETFWGSNGATAISGTCQFAVLLAPIRRALVTPVFSGVIRNHVE